MDRNVGSELSIATIISDAHPQDDPRTAFWATSICRVGYETSTELFSGSSFRRYQRIEQTLGASNVLAEHFFSPSIRSKLLALIDQSDSRPIAKIVNALQKQDLKKASIGHRQLVQKCLHMTVLGLYLSASEREVSIGLDLQGAIAALVTKAFSTDSVVTVYDAQEVVTAGVPNLTIAEKKFWIDTEVEIVRSIDHVVTVSPGIADWYREQFGRSPWVIPNFEPISNCCSGSKSENMRTKFVYFGGCDETKGLDHLVKSWPTGSEVAELHIVARESTDRARVEAIALSRGLKGSTVFFDSHNDSRNIVQILEQFDVGVVPYQMKYPYSEASPNKLGQYLAAGLAIATPRTGFVSDLVEGNQLGMVVPSFSSTSTPELVRKMSEKDFLAKSQENVRKKFLDELNWDNFFDRWYLAHKDFLQTRQTVGGHCELFDLRSTDQFPYRRGFRDIADDLRRTVIGLMFKRMIKSNLARFVKARIEESDRGRRVINSCLRRLN